MIPVVEVASPPVALVFSYQFPGRFAFNVLAAAVASSRVAPQISMRFPRTREELASEIRSERAAGRAVVAAWSFYSASFPDAARELAWLRRQLPEGSALCVAGGVHATAEPEQVLRAGFDLAGVGEGERSLVELLSRVASGEDPRRARGFAFLEGDRAKRTGAPEPVDLDEFPAVAAAHHKFGPIEITRGCVWACRFCQTPFASKARFRHRSVEGVAAAVRALRAEGMRDARFVTPSALSYGASDAKVDLDAVGRLLSAVREAAGPEGRVWFGTFPSEVRPEHVSAEALALLRRYVDNDNLIIGGQSGSARVLKLARRGHGVEEIVRAARLSLEAGFLPNVDFIVGLPGETDEDVGATLRLMDELAGMGARVHAHTFLPLPGTPWRDATPGSFDERIRRSLERLASRGRLFGQWQRQAGLAREISSRRTARRSMQDR